VVSFTPLRLNHGLITPGIHWIRDWMSLRAGPDVLAKRKKPFCPVRSLVTIPTELKSHLKNYI